MIEFSSEDLVLINCYQALNPRLQGELRCYVEHLLIQQYKQDLRRVILTDPMIKNLINVMGQIVQREEFEVEQIEKRACQLSDVYFSLFSETYCRYLELVPDLDCYDQIRSLGNMVRDNIIPACYTGDRSLILSEVMEFSDAFYYLSKKKDARQLIAV